MTNDQPPRRSDASRNHEAILAAATTILAVDQQASMKAIARASGTGRTTLYRHFPDREALVSAIYDRAIAEADAIAAQRLGGGGNPVDVVADLCEAFAARGDRYRFLEQYEAELLAHDPNAVSRRQRSLRDYLLRAQRSGAVRPDLDVDWLFSVLVALVKEATARHFADTEERGRTLRATVRAVLSPEPRRA